jgi:translocation and assembly module TamA
MLNAAMLNAMMRMHAMRAPAALHWTAAVTGVAASVGRGFGFGKPRMHRFIYLGYREPNPPANGCVEKGPGKLFQKRLCKKSDKRDAFARKNFPTWTRLLAEKNLKSVWACVVLCVFVVACAHQKPRQNEDWDLCPGIRIHGQINPGLSDTERNLVCGDPKQVEWSRLPLWQSEYDLKNFLQERGIYRPKFIVQSKALSAPGSENIGKAIAEGSRGTVLLVDVGEPTRVTKITSVDAPEELDLGRRRFVVGQVMTPALLNDMEGWVSHELRVYGYACPKVKAEGDPDTGELRVTVDRGPVQRIVREIEDQVPGMDPGVLRRYHAFGFGDRYNENLINLSSQRVMRLGLFDSDYFTSSCGPDGVTVRENVVAGPPRLLSFGAGIDTEGYVQGRATWTHARLGRKASVFSASVNASSKVQQLNLSLDWYAFEAANRASIRPVIQLQHDNENAYEIAQATAQLGYQKTWEWPISKGTFQVGPQFQQIHTFRGFGPPNSRFLMLASQLEFVSHAYELYLTQPRSGFDLAATADFSRKGIVTSVTAQRLGFRYEALFNVLNKEPPFIVLGWRGSFDMTLTPAASLQQGDQAQLPPTFTYFLGGSRDLRGFGRLSLPADGKGRLTAVFSGLESRLVSVLPFNLEPFVFVDVGALGPLPGTLRDPIYYSPGIGLRWAPSFGAFRTTLARGYPLDAPGGWQFYFSFGEEF